VLARAAALIFAFTAVSRVLGFLRETVFAATFGASAELDAYFVAQGPQNIVITLVSTAVVTSAIPVLAAYVSEADEERARATFNAVFTLVLGALIAAAGLMAIFAEPLVRLTAPGFDDEQVELATRLARILLAASALVAATNLLGGLLQAHRRFLWPAVVGIPFNVAMIGAALLLAGELGAVALALGFVLGSAARVAVLAPGLREIRFRPALRFDLGDPGLRRILALAPLVLVGHSVANVNLVVDRLVGSTQAEGTISALNYGFRLVTLPHGLIALALIQAAYPALGSASGAEDRQAFRELMRRSLATLALLLVPVAAARPAVPRLARARDARLLRLRRRTHAGADRGRGDGGQRGRRRDARPALRCGGPRRLHVALAGRVARAPGRGTGAPLRSRRRPRARRPRRPPGIRAAGSGGRPAACPPRPGSSASEPRSARNALRAPGSSS
jgi:putative peptidoglycan lipid II flippase